MSGVEGLLAMLQRAKANPPQLPIVRVTGRNRRARAEALKPELLARLREQAFRDLKG